MTDPYDRPRIYINWQQVRPNSWRAWLVAIGFVALAIAVLALVAVIASTLFVVAVVVGLASALAWFVGNLFRRRSREIGPYRGNHDA